MGIRHLASAIYHHHGLDPTAKLLLIAIADHINDETGYGWPSMHRLGQIAGIDRRNVVRWIERLEESGHIIVDRTKKGRANGYRLPVTPPSHPTSDAGITGGVTPAPLTSDAGVTRTGKNPKGTRRGVPDSTPTPPPIADVIAMQERYR